MVDIVVNNGDFILDTRAYVDFQFTFEAKQLYTQAMLSVFNTPAGSLKHNRMYGFNIQQLYNVYNAVDTNQQMDYMQKMIDQQLSNSVTFYRFQNVTYSGDAENPKLTVSVQTSDKRMQSVIVDIRNKLVKPE